MENVMLYVMGSRGSYPIDGEAFREFGGQTSCYILRWEKQALIIDCGTGLYDAAEILRGCETVTIVLTHLHYDHILGLLKRSVFPENAELTIYCRCRNEEPESIFDAFFHVPFWPVKQSYRVLTSPGPGESLQLSEHVKICFYPMGEQTHPNGVDFLQIDAYGKRISFLCDCEYMGRGCKTWIRNSDLMIYDGMYGDEEHSSHLGWGHSTWQEGCRIARENGIQKLWITHHAPERTDADLHKLETEARKLFPEAHFVRCGDQYRIRG